MFVQLMQQSPEILQALGMSPQALKLEMDKMEKIDKLKVHCSIIHSFVIRILICDSRCKGILRVC